MIAEAFTDKHSKLPIDKYVEESGVKKLSKYHRTITKRISIDKTTNHGDGMVTVNVVLDFYDIANAWKSGNPAIDHAVKKLLMPGDRHSKDRMQDIKEAKDSLARAIEIEAEKHA